MMAAGVAIGLRISRMFALTALVLWIMGCLYNFPPVRTKDVPYLDVLTESVNNPSAHAARLVRRHEPHRSARLPARSPTG